MSGDRSDDSPACEEAPSVMIGLYVKPDSRYFTTDMAQNTNDLLGSIRDTACRFAPDVVNDANLDQMFNFFNVPEVVETSCARLINEMTAKADESMRDAPPEWSQLITPIGREAVKLAKSIVVSECVDDKITRATLKASTKARVKVLCNVSESDQWLR
jgi:hypothetical protein